MNDITIILKTGKEITVSEEEADELRKVFYPVEYNNITKEGEEND